MTATLTQEELKEIHQVVMKLLNTINDLTIQIYIYQMGWDNLIKIAGDVVIIAFEIGEQDNIEQLKFNVIMNWKKETVERYSHPAYYKHFFN